MSFNNQSKKSTGKWLASLLSNCWEYFILENCRGSVQAQKKPTIEYDKLKPTFSLPLNTEFKHYFSNVYSLIY